VVTKEVEKMRAYKAAGPKTPACWQVSDDGFQYDARDQAVIECWWGNHVSRRQAVKHVTRLMGDVLSAGSGSDASQLMVRLLTVLRHMSGYFPRDFLFVPFLSTVEALLAAPLPADGVQEVAQILRGFELQSPAIVAAAGGGEFEDAKGDGYDGYDSGCEYSDDEEQGGGDDCDHITTCEESDAGAGAESDNPGSS
jgi:hypothetical protein